MCSFFFTFETFPAKSATPRSLATKREAEMKCKQLSNPWLTSHHVFFSKDISQWKGNEPQANFWPIFFSLSFNVSPVNSSWILVVKLLQTKFGHFWRPKISGFQPFQGFPGDIRNLPILRLAPRNCGSHQDGAKTPPVFLLFFGGTSNISFLTESWEGSIFEIRVKPKSKWMGLKRKNMQSPQLLATYGL